MDTFKAHITYTDSIRAIDLENTIRTLRLSVQESMREQKGGSVKKYTNDVQISGVQTGSIFLEFISENIDIISLGLQVADLCYNILRNCRQDRNEAAWKKTAFRDIVSAIKHGCNVTLENDNEIVHIFPSWLFCNVSTKKTIIPNVGDVVKIKSGSVPMTVSRVRENGIAECVFWGKDNKKHVEHIPIQVLVKL